jgi:hypothetical protein
MYKWVLYFTTTNIEYCAILISFNSTCTYRIYITSPRSCWNIFRLCRKDYKRWIFIEWKCIKIRCQQKCQNYFFINVWRKGVFDIYFTELGAALTAVLHVLFKHCCKYCYSDSRKLWAVMKRGGLAL